MTLSGISGGYIAYEYNKLRYTHLLEKENKNAVVPNSVLIAPTICGSIFGIALYPVVAVFSTVGIACWISDVYDVWVKNKIKSFNK